MEHLPYSHTTAQEYQPSAWAQAREAMKFSGQRPQISASFLLPGVVAFTDWSRVTVAKR